MKKSTPTNPVYHELEVMIISLRNNGKKTAGSLARKVTRTFNVKKRVSKK